MCRIFKGNHSVYFTCILPECVCVCIIPVAASGSPEEGVGSPETGVTGGYESACAFWEQNLDPLQEQLLLLITDPSLQPWKTSF